VTGPLDLRPFEAAVLDIVDRHALGPAGEYERWTSTQGPGERHRGPNPYGCADAANLLYTLHALPTDAASRAGFVDTLQSMQDPRVGLFRESTHDPIHTTAHCVAALELFDARPRHRLTGLDAWRDPERLVAFLEGLDWRTNPWTESHRGAGLYAALHIVRESTPEWEAHYFDWISSFTDPDTGMPGGAQLGEGERRDWFLFPMLAGTFHYLFNEQHARRPHAHAEALVETCLEIRSRALFPLCKSVGFAEIDWVYCLHRGVRQSGHRFEEAHDALRDFAREYVAHLATLDAKTDPGLDDLHALFGAVCAIAELQGALPGEILTEQPWRLVLDRRPFI
jgi:hypothetical protein